MRAILLSLILMSATAPLLSAADPARQSIEVSYADCDVFGALIPAREDLVEPHVAEGFTLRGDGTGVVTLGVVFVDCPIFAVEGKAEPAMDYFVLLAELDGGIGSYDLLEITTSDAWQNAMEVVDKPSLIADSMVVDFIRPAGEVVHGFAYVEHGGEWVKATAVPAAGVPMSTPSPSYHWGLGTHGRIYAQHDNVFSRFGASLITLEGSPGSLLVQLVGAEQIVLPGVEGRYCAISLFESPPGPTLQPKGECGQL